MNSQHSQKRKRSNDSIGECSKEGKKTRVDDIIDLIDYSDTNKNDEKNLHGSVDIGLNIKNNVEEIKSKVFKSKQKINFMHAIWKLEIPSQKFESNFRAKEDIFARENISCKSILDFNYNNKQFSFSIQIGQKNSIEKYCEDKNNEKIEDFELANRYNNREEIKLQEFLPENLSRNAYKNTDICNSPTVSVNSNSSKISVIFSSDDNRKDILRDTIEEEVKLKFDLEKNHANSPVINNSEEQMHYIQLKYPDDLNEKNSSPNAEENTVNINLFKPLNYNENLQKLENLSNYEESYNVSINFCIEFNKFMNFSFSNLPPEDIKTKSVKISDEAYAQLTKQPRAYNYSNQTPGRVPIVIQIDITKNLPRITKYMGMINEGTTCYMNSILQSLNFIGYFKNAVFQIPLATKENLSQSVTYSLQKIFYDLMTEFKAISTMKLIKSFGWSKEDMLIQHDVQEFNLTLSELMENKMKGTKAEGTFKYLFEGRLVNYIHCLNVEYKSIKEENFHDLQLTVKGCNNIYESLDKYTEEEILDEDNKYDAGRYGKQIAQKGVKFLEVPKVLMLQLKRFEYNFQKDCMEKVNDYFEFYNEINLSKYIANTTGSIDEYTYSLHSVLVHAGFPNTGHYFAYIKPEINSKWIKFNDEDVKYADEYEVFENNFGGDLNVFKHTSGGNISGHNFKSDSNSYILTYIKNSMKESLLKNVSEEDIPNDLKILFKKEKLEEKKQILEEIRGCNNIDIYLFSKEIVMSHPSLGLTNSDSNIDEGINFTNLKNRLTLNVPKEMKIIDFIKFLSMKTKIPPHKIKLFKYVLTYPNLILKRFTYNANQIGENLFNDRIKDLYNSFYRNLPFLLYVHIDDTDNDFEFMQEEKEGKIWDENPEDIISQINNLLSDNINPHTLETPEEEYISVIIEDDTNQIIQSNQIIYYSKKENFWNFKQNYYNNSNSSLYYDSFKSKNNYERHMETDSADGEALCVIKYLNIKSTDESYESSLKIGEIVTLKKSQSLSSLYRIFNFKEKYKNYLDESLIKAIDYEKAEAVFMIEYTSMDQLPQYRNPIVSAHQCNANSLTEGCKNSVLCLIINLKWEKKFNYFGKEIDSFKGLIVDCCDSLLFNIVIKFNFLADKKHGRVKSFGKDKKIKFKLNQSESEMKQAILNEIKPKYKDQKLIEEIFSLENPFDKLSHIDYYVYSIDVDLINIYEFIEVSQADIIELVPLPDSEREPNSFYKDYPAVRYLNRRENEYHLLFAINFIPTRRRDQQINFYNVDFVLFDINNNLLLKITLSFPQSISKFSEILDLMRKKNILSKFYKNYCESNYDVMEKDENINDFGEVIIKLKDNESLSNIDNKINSNNFCFMLQHPETMICYEFILNKNDNIKFFESKPDPISYRLQPYSSQEMSLIAAGNKLFFSVVDADLHPVYFPLTLFFDKLKTKVITMKQIVLNKLKNIECLMRRYEEDFNSKNCLTRIKFYTFVLHNYKPRQNIYISPDKDDSFLSEILEPNSLNIMIKLPSGGYSNLMIKHG